jgi:hypothetical protein
MPATCGLLLEGSEIIYFFEPLFKFTLQKVEFISIDQWVTAESEPHLNQPIRGANESEYFAQDQRCSPNL